MTPQSKDLLYYEHHGDPALPPIVFVHGFMGNCRDWAPIVAALCDHFHCLTIDLPGHGRSLDVSDAAYTVPGAAEAVVQVMHDAGVASAPMVGYSLGGRIALALAVHHPALCSALIIESATAGVPQDEVRVERRQQDEKWARMLEQGVFEEFLRTWYSQPVFASLTAIPETLEAVMAQRRSNDPKYLAKAMRGFSVGSQTSLWEQLSSIDMPVLLITGEKDTKYVRVLKKMAHELPSARIIIAPDAGHNVHVESPLRFVEDTRVFLSKEPL